MNLKCGDDSNNALENGDHYYHGDDYSLMSPKNHCGGLDKDDDSGDYDLLLGRRVTIGGDDRHDYNARDGNGHDDARIVNRDNGIGCPNTADQYYSPLHASYSKLAA
jgi:hypothetical protein